MCFIVCTWRLRHTPYDHVLPCVQSDPVACAAWFDALIPILFTELIGLPVSGRKTQLPLCDRRGLLVGVPLAFLNVVETQMRGTAQLLVRVCARACSVLDV